GAPAVDEDEPEDVDAARSEELDGAPQVMERGRATPCDQRRGAGPPSRAERHAAALERRQVDDRERASAHLRLPVAGGPVGPGPLALHESDVVAGGPQ